MSNSALTSKQQRFVEEYLVDLSGTKAAIRSGYSTRTARQIGDENLSKLAIRAAIDRAIADRSIRTGITQDEVLRRLWSIVTANATDVVSHRLGACRYCHGIDHDYQWRTVREFEEACAKARAEQAAAPSDDGGFGYSAIEPPHPSCPECDGLGVGRIQIADMTALRGPAALLFDGARDTRHGVEVRLQDRARALEMVARHLGMFSDKLTIKGDAENPLTLLIRQMGKSALPVVAAPPLDDDYDEPP